MRTCLIVDNSRMIRRVAGRIIQELEFKTEEADNGQDALDYCMFDMPDVVLLDWNMPIMDGLTFLKRLRAKQGGDKPVVVFCTAERSLEKITEALEAGANEYIMKPFDRDIVASKFYQAGLLSA